MIILVIVFCFKQKTAYEMRISDWSSDVCSSDLQSIPAGSRRIRIRTCQPAAASARTRWRPMKPVAPVMATTGASATAPGSGGTHALACTFEIKLTCAGATQFAGRRLWQRARGYGATDGLNAVAVPQDARTSAPQRPTLERTAGR